MNVAHRAMSNKEVTITDIALKLGISYATVSRALADHPRISLKTKKRVNELATSLGYRPNNYARNLRDQKTYTIGVIVPRLNSLFMSAVIAGMEATAQENGYSLLISQSSESVEIERQNIKTMYNSRVDGLLVSVAYDTTDSDHFSLFFKKNIPVVFFDRHIEGNQNLCVVIDNKKAGYTATKHLIDEGCNNILHITANSRVNVYSERLAGYQQALTESGTQLNENSVLFTDLSFEAGEKAAETIVQMHPRPDGLFIANDTCAAGCVVALKQRGIKIPEDIAVVGFNNDIVAKVVEPHLSTIDYPGYELGAIAAKQLIDRLNGHTGSAIANSMIIRSELVVRRSSLKQG